MNLSIDQKRSMYSVFRILIGLTFLLHGGQKLFGWFGGPGGNGPVELMSLFGLAGVIEFFGGLLILLGLFTSIIALIAALELVIAYFKTHIPVGINPLTNGGEVALLYFAAFLVLIAFGAGKFSLERKLFKKEFWHR